MNILAYNYEWIPSSAIGTQRASKNSSLDDKKLDSLRAASAAGAPPSTVDISSRSSCSVEKYAERKKTKNWAARTGRTDVELLAPEKLLLG